MYFLSLIGLKLFKFLYIQHYLISTCSINPRLTFNLLYLTDIGALNLRIVFMRIHKVLRCIWFRVMRGLPKCTFLLRKSEVRSFKSYRASDRKDLFIFSGLLILLWRENILCYKTHTMKVIIYQQVLLQIENFSILLNPK